MDDRERTMVWRRPDTPGAASTPETGRDEKPNEPTRAGEPVVNLNQPASGYPYMPAPTPLQRAVWRAQRIIYYIFGIVQAFILIRFILKLLAANAGSTFTQVIYNVSWVFVFPFYGVVPNYTAGGSVLEWYSLVAVVVYALVSVALAKLIGLLL